MKQESPAERLRECQQPRWVILRMPVLRASRYDQDSTAALIATQSSVGDSRPSGAPKEENDVTLARWRDLSSQFSR